MAEQANGLEQQVEKIILAGFSQDQPGEDESKTPPPQSDEGATGEHMIDVDMFRLEGGAVLFVPTNATNPLDTTAVESTITPTETDPDTTTTPPAEQDEQHHPPQEVEPVAPAKKRFKLPYIVVPLVLLFLLAAGAGSYFYLFPLTASATVTIIPQAKSLHKDVTLTIAQNPKPGQVQGRELQAISLTKSMTVPATGHAHEDATRAQGIITFYNANSQSYTIPAGVSFSVQGVTIVTDASVTVQAAIPPSFGIAIASAHAVQAGVAGNIVAHALSTRCCGSSFLTATNTSAFSGGQDAKDYSYIQTSDLQNGANTLLASLTPQAIEALNKEARTGEQLVPPLCNPHTSSDQQAGATATSVTVSVTQSCSIVAYLTNSLNQVATNILAHSGNFALYEQVGTTQVTVNSSTYEKHSALLQVSLSGIWVYHFTQAELTRLAQNIAGESQEQARATLEKVAGITQVSIRVQWFDFKDQLPTNAECIHIQLFYIVS